MLGFRTVRATVERKLFSLYRVLDGDGADWVDVDCAASALKAEAACGSDCPSALLLCKPSSWSALRPMLTIRELDVYTHRHYARQNPGRILFRMMLSTVPTLIVYVHTALLLYIACWLEIEILPLM